MLYRFKLQYFYTIELLLVIFNFYNLQISFIYFIVNAKLHFIL